MTKKSVLAVLIISNFLWSLSFIFIKIGLQGMTPLSLAAIRFILTSAFMAGLTLIFYSPKEMIEFAKENFLILFIIAIISVTGVNILQNIGMQYTTASASSILQSSAPIFTLILAALFLGEHLGMRKIAGLLISLIGVVIITTDGDPSSLLMVDGAFFGNVLLLLTATFYSIFTILSKKIIKGKNLLLILFITSFIGTIPLVAIWVITEPVTFYHPLNSWLAVLGLTLICGIAGTITYLWCLDRMEASKAHFFSFLVPLFSVIMASMFLEEPIRPVQIISGLLIIAGIWLVEKEKD